VAVRSGVNAVVVDRSAPGGLALAAVPEPQPLPSEAVVQVAAISLNLGEIRRSRAADDGWRPGWDFAGTIARAAADGSGPKAGMRVVGMLGSGAWAERIAAPTRNLAVVPASVSFERAATLPVAGLTALYALERRGSLLGRRVLVAETADAAHDTGPFDLILESVGGDVFASALRQLAVDGLLVTYGTSAERTSMIEVASFYAGGGRQVYGFILFHELECHPAGAGLARLAALLDAGKLEVRIDDTLPFAKIGEAAERLWSRGVTGKLVVTL
jgi:NADPH:quinone reductase-like Zn-dependent oxidoreductase